MNSCMHLLQERGLRSGTVPASLAIGLGKAAEICNQEMVGACHDVLG